MKRAPIQKTKKTTDQIQVFCRVKPPKNPEEPPVCIDILSPTLLKVEAPETCRSSRDANYIFQQIFSAPNSQKEVFDIVSLPLINNLISGENGLLFSYGVTGSGKTYTMNGDKNNAGIIPRAVSAVFNSVGHLLAPRFVFKSDNQHGFVMQDANAAMIDFLNEHRAKTTKKTSSENDLPCLLNDMTRATTVNEDNLYAVFVSYLEIYNNFIVNLLDNTGKLLRLREAYSNVFIDELKEVEVRSSEEALDMFNMGQKKKRMGITSMNKESSRSHSIFTIKIVQAPTDENGENLVNDSNLITVSQLSLVDLAGSERHSKTQTAGQSLSEACNINNSLMFLRNCLQALRENQTKGLNNKIQYRNCKLTHLFKNYFDGNGLIRMVICITPEIEDFNETVHVLEFAEMAQDIQTAKQVQVPNSRNIKFTPGRRKANQMMKDYIESENVFDSRPPLLSDFDNLTSELPPFIFHSPTEGLPMMRNLLNHLEARLDRQKSLIQEYNEKSGRFRESLINVEKENILKSFEISNLQNVNEDSTAKLKKMEEKNFELEQKIKEFRNKQIEMDQKLTVLSEATKEKERQMSQLLIERKKDKQKLTHKMEQMNVEVGTKLEAEKKKLKTQYEHRAQKLNMVKKILEQPTPATSELNINIVDGKKTVEKIDRTEMPAPGSVKRLIAQTQQKEKISAAQQYRRRRSKSCGDRWIEHKPIQTPISQCTLLQPKGNITKSVTKLSSIKDVANTKTSKYFLRSEEKEENGDIATKFYKGDVIPTISGGAQVIFDDIEVLKQESPMSAPSSQQKRRYDRLVIEDAVISASSSTNSSPGTSGVNVQERCNSGIIGYSKKHKAN